MTHKTLDSPENCTVDKRQEDGLVWGWVVGKEGRGVRNGDLDDEFLTKRHALSETSGRDPEQLGGVLV
jgi:hypothetical protein